ncbi:MAG: CotH kinase family protein [Anaerolineaceae bacterium]|nr:CotH kinase family protein [Anaerolineaceae bacterium]MDE0328452.1 CotH kinase family protein [Anaerolineaceae bacterium]
MTRGLQMSLVLLASLVFASAAPAQVDRPPGWTEASHGNQVPANYDVVLPDDRVNEMTIVFRPEDWAAAMENMTELYGERGEQAGGRGRGGPGVPGGPGGREILAFLDEMDIGIQAIMAAMRYMPDLEAVAAELELEDTQRQQFLALVPSDLALPGPGQFGAGPGQPGRGPGGGGGLTFAANPDWQPVTIHFNDKVWPEAGFRFKGNSSLSSGWRSGQSNLPFKLDLDEFENDHPALRNQRLYGFKQLSFSTNFSDQSLQREKVMADVFRAAGVPAAETSFWLVWLDTGDGSAADYLGLYTAVELPDDTLIETQFADDNGNMYKPDGRGATFAAGSFDEESFDKETNRDSGYEDVLTLFDALHDPLRDSDPAAWRVGLDATLDVDGFLRWLATNQVAQNWDVYGVLPHNYYLYADDTRGVLTWIPWDNNMSLQERITVPGLDVTAPQNPLAGGRVFQTEGFGRARSLSLEEVDDDWPLIRFLLDDGVYAVRYRQLVEEVAAGAFSVERMTAIYDSNAELLLDALSGVDDEEAMAGVRTGRDELLAHLERRSLAAAEWLALNSN